MSNQKTINCEETLAADAIVVPANDTKLSHKQGFEFAECKNSSPSSAIGNNEASSRMVSITRAAEVNNVTRQAIYVAIKLNKLKAYKETSRWLINLDDLEDYRSQRYSRTKSTFNGELIFDQNKGFFSVNQVSRMLNVPAQKIYYAMRIGLLKASRKGAAWVIHKDDLEGYKSGYLNRKAQQAAS